MTRPPPEDLRSPEVRLPPVIACSAGSGAAVDVSVRHRGSEPALLTLTVLGLDARWVPEPVVIGPLDPGESTTISLTLVPERGALGARYPFVVAVEATTRQSEPPVMGVAESVLAVDARERIAVAIVPNISSAVFGRRVEVQVTNPSQEDRALQLESTHAGGATLRLADTSIVVPAGRTGTVRGRIKVRHPRFLGSGSVHTVGVTARSTAAPEFAEASLRSRPVIRNGLRAAVAVGLVLALWAAAAIIFIPRLSDRFTAKNTPPVATAGSTAPASGSGAAGTGAGGTGATGTAASGTGQAPGGRHRGRRNRDRRNRGPCDRSAGHSWRARRQRLGRRTADRRGDRPRGRRRHRGAAADQPGRRRRGGRQRRPIRRRPTASGRRPDRSARYRRRPCSSAATTAAPTARR